MVTIVIPLYNAEPFISEAISSILSNTFQDFEVIIVDDNSTDNSLHIAHNLANFDSRISVFKNTYSKGVSGARNTGISKSKGEWIAFLDADDIYLPNALEARLAALNQYPDAEFISADFAYLFEDGSKSENGFYQTRTNPLVAPYFSQAFQDNSILKIAKPVNIFLDTVMVWTGAVLIKRSLFEKIGFFNESLVRCEDDHLWIRIARIADLYFVPSIVAFYRQHSASITKRDEPPGKWGLKAFDLLLQDTNFSPYKKLIKSRMARFHADSAYYFRTKRLYSKAVLASLTWVINDNLNKQAYRCLFAAILGK